jgi:hypothetical protein
LETVIGGGIPVSTDFVKNVFGQILGFISIFFVYIDMQFGLPSRKKFIRKLYGWSAAQLRNVHCNWGYLAMAAISLHAILLSQTLKWGNYFNWFTFYPQFLSFKENSLMMLGLDLAGLASTIFIFATLGGVFFKKIAQKFGYKKALLTQQVTYFALVFSLLHALWNGTWTITILPLQILQYVIVADVLISSLRFGYKKAKKTLEKEEKVESEKNPAPSENISQLIREAL